MVTSAAVSGVALVAIESKHLVTALRRDLARELEVDAVAPADAPARVDPARHALALVRAGEGTAALVDALRQAAPGLPVVAIYPDAVAADADPAALGADGVLVEPLTEAAVAATCRLAARVRAQARRIAELEARTIRARDHHHGHDLEFLKKVLFIEVKRSRRYGLPVSLALAALDGWPAPAAKLSAAARSALLADALAVVTRAVRDIDVAVPFADGQFIVLLPHTKADGALQAARRICARMRDHAGAVRMTASVGVGTHDGHGTVSFSALVKRASEALARARAAGGDQAESTAPRKRDRIVIG
jgi:diguanylate cyclase (GGDEF)-like protein